MADAGGLFSLRAAEMAKSAPSAPGEASPPAATPPVHVFEVGRVVAYLRELLDTDPVVADLWIAGEVTSLSRSQAGHLYFSLTDGSSALHCVFFRRENQGVAVEQGARVNAHGRVSIYPERGDLQFYVDALEPEGMGVLHAEFQRLLARLEQEGLFETARKRALPRYPRTIGVVTSPAGAVWHDIQSVLGRRWPLAALELAPCRVQGEGAAESIVRAIQRLNARAAEPQATLDVIVVARGGGSIEELWPFNEEAVARAIFASAVPAVSAVGHETDYTVADHVADLRAPTPSAAAELLSPDQREERQRIQALRSALARALGRRADAGREALERLQTRLDRGAPDFPALRLLLDDLLRRAADAGAGAVTLRLAALSGLHGRLTALSPGATLARGYAIVQDEGGHTVRRAASLRVGERVRLRFSDGAAGAEVIDSERS